MRRIRRVSPLAVLQTSSTLWYAYGSANNVWTVRPLSNDLISGPISQVRVKLSRENCI
jgi:hypothetical protein